MPQDTTELDPKLLELLVCPLTKGPLVYDQENSELISEQANLAYSNSRWNSKSCW